MGKLEKKKQKLQERITMLEADLKNSLTKKTSNVKEMDVPTQMRKIQELQKELSSL